MGDAALPGVYGHFLEISCECYGSGERATSYASSFKKKWSLCACARPRVRACFLGTEEGERSSRRVPFFGLLATILSTLGLRAPALEKVRMCSRSHTPACPAGSGHTLRPDYSSNDSCVSKEDWGKCTCMTTPTHAPHPRLPRCCCLAQDSVRILPHLRGCASLNFFFKCPLNS